MEYRLDNKKINIKNLKVIGSGVEGASFKYRGYALKVKYNDKIGLSYDDCKYMIGTRTSNILLPKAILYKNDKYIGYATKYIHSLNNFKLTEISKEELINNILIPIEKDIRIISNRNILLNDISYSDTIKSRSLYIIDPGSYAIINDMDSSIIESYNYKEIRKLINYMIYLELKKYKNCNSFIKTNDYFSYYIKNNVPDNKSIKEYILKR